MITITNKIHWLREQAELHPDDSGYILAGRNISYRKFYLKCKSAAEYFLSYNIKENDHIGILSGHNYNFFTAVNALWFIGAIPVPLNTRNTPDELQFQVNKANIKFLLIDESYEGLSSSIKNSTKIPFPYFTEHESLNLTNIFSNPLSTSALPPEGLIKSEGQESKFLIERPALILFTSGSSGKPKAVLHTFGSLLESVKTTDSLSALTSSDVWLASLPFYHIGGFMILLRSLVIGSKAAFPNSLKYEEIKTSIEQFNPTHISLVPTTLQRLINDNIRPNNNLKIVYLGGGPSDSKLCLDAVRKGWNIVKVFGSTETCSMSTALLPHELKNKIESAGRAIGSNQIKIVDEEGKQLGPIQIGEIAVFSKTLFKEYFNEPLITNRTLKDGWYYTGDYGWIDEHGFLYIEFRREDLIITGGENVAAAEVETAIKSNPLIEDAYVFGIEDKTWGQTVAAVIKTKIKDSITKDELRIYLKERIAGYKIPKEFYFVESIPKNEMGKVIRNDIIKLIKLS
jgi:O-succinylbenzoic acid--CoA ligase